MLKIPVLLNDNNYYFLLTNNFSIRIEIFSSNKIVINNITNNNYDMRNYDDKNKYGRIYVVATPIGNLEDITLRALKILREVDFVICEDTRVTKILFDHYSIQKKFVVVNANNEEHQIEKILQEIKSGFTCALVSDAGTPLISDPGSKLLNEAVKNKITIVPVPGPSAITTALSISGLPSSSFVFEGFLPQKKGRQKKLQELAEEERTIVIYESMYRIKKLIEELKYFMPDRPIVVARELTKKFEEIWRGTPEEILKDFDKKIIKGEFVIIIAPKNFSNL
ncbi:MAG: 16S rRNA (cytidine(1402)-2'-O)-methyltransferase [Melioribacter sp.]|uniref:16S rRNA (cytidine(1402)-2'-O)-methyltransferase n=1 Tax=Rosettibacter primus TaxID=3111523 RepID=UPI00247C4625|nr:16S rRNA (cytidine(1402)-2'-O)-methyltransferase [Melioribacter sp.]